MPIKIDGSQHDLPSDTRVSLLDFLREDLQLRGTKKCCNLAACSAGTALLAGTERIGEIGITGVALAVANAVYNATGRRVRDLPITLDKLL